MSDNDSGITPLTPAQEQTQETKALHEGYLHRDAVEADMLANVITGGNTDETISSRAARAATEGKEWGKVLSKGLDLIQPNHGATAIASDLERAKEAEYLEENSGTLPKE